MLTTAARSAVVVALVGLVAASCSFARSSDQRDADATSSRVGDGVPDVPGDPRAADSDDASAAPATTTEAPPETPPPLPASSDGEFDLVVRGADGAPRSGITATVTGPRNFSLTSGAGGRLRYKGPAGHYEVRIEPTCGESIQVQTSAVGRVAVAAEQVAGGSLSVTWRHRFAPGAPVSYQAEGGGATGSLGRRWPVGSPYVVRFAVLDRCSGQAAPRARYPTFRFATSPEVALEVAEPVADEEGNGFVRLTCRAPVAEIELTATDAEAPSDRIDLFSRALLDDSPPECV